MIRRCGAVRRIANHEGSTELTKIVNSIVKRRASWVGNIRARDQSQNEIAQSACLERFQKDALQQRRIALASRQGARGDLPIRRIFFNAEPAMRAKDRLVNGKHLNN
jgi:hypothetical protein